MKKIFTCAFVLMCAFFLTGCQDIKEIVNEVENMIIEESMNQLANELGVEGFALPEYEDLSIEFTYDNEEDISKLGLEIVQPDCTLEEYRDEVVNYVEDALKEHLNEDDLSLFIPTEIEDGYEWSYNFDKTSEDGTVTNVKVNVQLTQDENGDFDFEVELENLGDIFSAIKDKIEEESSNQTE